MDLDILLGPVLNDAHARKLAEVAAWLDQNKFPCTFSVAEGCGHLTVASNPDDPKDWPKVGALTSEPPMAKFRHEFLVIYCQHVITALAAHLNPEAAHEQAI